MKTASVYLDYAAATPLGPEALKAMQPFFSDEFYNPSSSYLAARSTKRKLDEARAGVAHWLGARPGEIIFTAGATEANNLAIQGAARRFEKGKLLVSAIEHDSVLAPAVKLKAGQVPVKRDGLLDLAAFRKMLGPDIILVSIGLVNNEIGVIQPLKEVAEIIRQERRERLKSDNRLPIYLHTDAAQAGNFFDLHCSRLGVDMMSINGGKIYGPKQSGALFIRAGVELEPLILGGGQERGLRSGTENVASAWGLAKALDLAQANRREAKDRISALRQLFVRKLSADIPDAVVNGSTKHVAPHITSLTLPGFDNERLMMELDEAGIQCATGSACSASAKKPSHVLAATGLSEEAARSTLRFSFGRETTDKQLLFTVKTLAGIIAGNR